MGIDGKPRIDFVMLLANYISRIGYIRLLGYPILIILLLSYSI